MKHFAHLHCHSYYSFYSGTISPQRLVELACNHNMPAVTLTDHNGMYGIVSFYKKALQAGIKPIIGVDLAAHSHKTDAVLLAKDYFGYGQLCELITELQLNDSFSLISALQRLHEEGKAKDNDYHFITLVNDPAIAHTLCTFLDKNHLYIEAHPALKKPSLLRNLSETLHRNVVVTGNVYFEKPEDKAVHCLLRAIGELRTLNSGFHDFIAHDESYFLAPSALHGLLSMYPSALSATRNIIEQCNVVLPIKEYRFPKFNAAAGEQTHCFLRRLCFQNALVRYGVRAIHQLPLQVVNRISIELQVIEQLGFADYFLLVWDIVQYAKSKGIPSIGRGSAANSIVSYVLGITDVEPISNNLYFERFLNSERKSPPDIDVDFCWKRRDEVLNYVYKKYGEDKVAMISTHVTFSARSLVREIGKAMGVSAPEIDRFTSRLPHFFHGEQILDAAEKIPECRSLPVNEEPLRTILHYASKINHFPRHLSIHAGGIVVSPSRITEYTPLERASKGFIVTQYDMFSIEDMGLVKIDLLSQRSLSVYADTVKVIRAQYRKTLPTNPEYYYNDARTRTLIREGKTIGCFYIESPAMRQLLYKLKVDTFPMLTAASSVIRPGVAESGMMQQYIRRHHKTEPVSFLHPKMNTILHETYGVMIYQEDVIRVAHEVVGLSLQEADLLRRAMSGKERSVHEMEKLQEHFIRKALVNGLSEEIAHEIWRQIASFAGYAFCKAHSASYAQLSFKVAYLKAHYPAEFMAAVLSNQGGFYHPSVYLSETRLLGLRILLPDINKSQYHYTVEIYPPVGQKVSRFSRQCNAIRIGFLQIKHLSHSAITAVISQRKKGPYTSLEDFLLRTDVPCSEVEILIKIGAMNFIQNAVQNTAMKALTIPQLLWKLKLLYPLIQKWKTKRNGIIAKEPLSSMELPDLPGYSLRERIKLEEEYLGMPVSVHPLVPYLQNKKMNGAVSSRYFKRYVGKTIHSVGWLTALKRITTSKGDYMLFISFEDMNGFYEATLFPQAYSQYGSILTDRGPYRMTGTVNNEYGSLSIKLESIQHL